MKIYYLYTECDKCIIAVSNADVQLTKDKEDGMILSNVEVTDEEYNNIMSGDLSKLEQELD
jgi:hypothetical protein